MPAHEIEKFIETTIRNNIEQLCDETDGPILEHLLKHQEDIPAYDLIRKCVSQITINLDELTLKIKPKGFKKLVEKHLNVSVTGCEKELEIKAAYKTSRAKRGAIVIEAKDEGDVFDLPSDKLKKLVQGVIWRDEHFAGKTLTEIARREGCSDAHVGKCIIGSFDLLLVA